MMMRVMATVIAMVGSGDDAGDSEGDGVLCTCVCVRDSGKDA